jgi:hypothetical protein
MLQLSRCLPAVLTLVRAGREQQPQRVRAASIDIATDILRCARDRSRDRNLRPLLDQQQRTDSLTKPRRRSRKKAA